MPNHGRINGLVRRAGGSTIGGLGSFARASRLARWISSGVGAQNPFRARRRTPLVFTDTSTA